MAAWLLLVIAGAAPMAAGAQGLPALAAPAPKPAVAASPPLSPAETRQMLDLLNDPQKRAAFTATLETLSKATAAAAPAKPAPLAPDSVGAQLLRESTTWLTGLSGQLTSFGRVLGDLPSVWAFSLRVVANPAMRAQALDAAWRLALVLAAAALAEWGSWALLRRPKRAIARLAPDAEDGRGGAPPALPPASTEAEARMAEAVRAADAVDEDAPLADSEVAEAIRAEVGPEIAIEDHEIAVVEQVLRRRRFVRVVRALRRLPFVLLCFVLDLLPMGVFLTVGYAGTVLQTPHMQEVLQAAILAYAVCRLATSLTRMIYQPELPSLRLLHVGDESAAYAVRWVRRITAIGALGYAASQIGHLFGLPQQADDAFLKAVFLVVHLCLILVVLQCRAAVAALIRSHKPKRTVGARVRDRLASVWHLIAIFYIAGLWMVWAAEVRHGYVRIWHVFLVSVGVLAAARVISIFLLGALDRGFRVSPATADRYPGLGKRADRYHPVLRRIASFTLIVVTALALLQAWGINTFLWFHANALGGRLVSASLTILIAGAIALAIWEFCLASLDNRLAHLTKQAQLAKSARLRTLMPILRSVLLTSLLGVFGLTALSEIGVNIAPLLAGAGILGVAIGFGSQKLVQDFITGIFLLIENAMQVGDWVTVAGLSGSVENLSIRTMRLRAGDGSVHIIPFSSVSTVTNVNRGIGNAAITVSVPFAEDSDQVSEILTDIAREMRGEARFAEMMRSDFQLWGVDRVEAGVLTVVGQIVCTDSGRWGVQREFNRRMAIRFKQEGVRIATPVQTVYNHVQQEVDQPAVSQEVREVPSAQVALSPPPAALGNTS